jgi:hypothetical protein
MTLAFDIKSRIHCLAGLSAAAIVSTCVAGAAQSAPTETIGSLITKGGKVQDLFVSQEYPYFLVISGDSKPYVCALSIDEAFGFFDYRQPSPPASIGSRCSELK